MKIFGIVGNHGEISLSRRESENWKYLRLEQTWHTRGKNSNQFSSLFGCGYCEVQKTLNDFAEEFSEFGSHM